MYNSFGAHLDQVSGEDGTRFEVLLPHASQKYAVIDDLEPDAEGWIHAPTEPGLGAAIDFDLIEREKTAVLE